MTSVETKLIQGDCLEKMQELIAQGVKVDAIITDPPYGTTACKWDSVIPFEPMWECLKALRKERTPILLFGAEPFSSALRMSNIKEFKYDWVWIKSRSTGHLDCNRKPMKCVEDIIVFYKKQPRYNIELVTLEMPISQYRKTSKSGSLLGKTRQMVDSFQHKTGYPVQALTFKCTGGVHPTQKPVLLLEYLIKTYTNEGDTVLDFTMGSGSTGVACRNLNRSFIGIEQEDKYFKIANDRISSD